jgi:Trk K+ transport system NAD-binding subunit
MTPGIVAVKESDSLDVAMTHISNMDLTALPVVNDSGCLIGTISRQDIMLFFEHEILMSERVGTKMKFAREHKTSFSLLKLPEGHGVVSIVVGSKTDKSRLSDFGWRQDFDANIISIQRTRNGHAKLHAPSPEFVFENGDILTITGPRPSLEKIRQIYA